MVLHKYLQLYNDFSVEGYEMIFIEEVADQVTAYEIKLNKGKSKPPPSWDQQYSGAYHLINKTNYSDFLI